MTDYFSESIQILEKKQPSLAQALKDLDCKTWQFCKTKKEELNLKKEEKGEFKYYHSMDGAVDELKKWSKEKHCNSKNVMIVFGVGLGYIYEVLREWLWLSVDRYLIVLEDDLEVIHRLLETEKGLKMVQDEQVQIRYYRSYQEDYETLQRLLWSCMYIPYKKVVFGFEAVPFYEQEKKDKTAETDGYIRGNIDNIGRAREGMSNVIGVTFNFFHNVRALPYSFSAQRLEGKFQGVPAIICGGGPSLDQQIDVLKEFENRALILGAGAGINVLTHYHILPHFNFGIDPNVIHYSRMLTQLAFEVPYGYSHRIHYEGIHSIHSPKVYFPKEEEGSDMWFDQNLDLKTIFKDKRGVSVANFCVKAAHALGCNPIILVGIDLSYGKERSYSHGVVNHPLISQKTDFHTFMDPQYVRNPEDVTSTTVQFLREKKWFESFAKMNPELELINASIGGMEILGFKNLTLKEARARIKDTQRDLPGFLHSEIFQSGIPKATPEKIEGLIDQWRQMIEEVIEFCDQMNQELLKSPMETTLSGELVNLITQFNELPVYKHCLSLNENTARFVYEAKREIWGKEINYETLFNLYSFLKIKALSMLEVIKQTKTRKRKTQDRAWPLFPPGLGICMEEVLEEEWTPPKECKASKELFSSGEVKNIQHYKGELLHGPAIHYNEFGRVIAKNYFINGKKEGRSWLYYDSGAVYAIECYREGRRNGRQRYFYEDGSRRTIVDYVDGVLHGDLWEYYPEGDLKREMHFENGLRNGFERLWDESTHLRLQLKWEHDRPVEIGRLWRHDGALELEARYQADARNPVVHHYDTEDVVLEQIMEMTHSAKKLQYRMEQALAQLGNFDWEKIDPSLKEETKEQLKQAAEQLREYGKRFSETRNKTQ